MSIVTATTEEYALGPTQAGGKLCAERINKQEGRSDLRPSFIDIIGKDGESLFNDIFSKGAAELIREVTEKEYRAGGGGGVRVLRSDS